MYYERLIGVKRIADEKGSKEKGKVETERQTVAKYYALQLMHAAAAIIIVLK